MLIPVRCMTCGLGTIGAVATLFRRLRAERTRKILAERGTLPVWAAIDPELSVPVGDILDRLGVAADCCRMHLATAMVFSDYY